MIQAQTTVDDQICIFTLIQDRLQAILQPRPTLLIVFIGLPLAPSSRSADIAAQLYKQAAPSIFVISVRNPNGKAVSFGTGFLVGKSTLVTNAHVVEGGDTFVEQGAFRIPASLEKRDSINDVAIIKVGIEIAAAPLTISEKKPSPGESIFVIGNPEGLEKSISTGVVADVRDFNGRQLLQITAPISHGSSGGPVLNAAGKVVGITIAMLKDGQNLNFAVPAEKVRDLTAGRVLTKTNVSALFRRIDELKALQDQQQYSKEPDSEWQKYFRQIDSLFKSALDQAAKDPKLLVDFAKEASDKDLNVQIVAAQRATDLRPSVESNLLLGNGLRAQAWFSEQPATLDLQKRAEKGLPHCFENVKSSNC